MDTENNSFAIPAPVPEPAPVLRVEDRNPFAVHSGFINVKLRDKLQKEKKAAQRKARQASLALMPRPKPPPKASLKLTAHGRFRPVSGELSSDMISNLLDIGAIKDFLNRASAKDKSRMAALLYTLYPAKKVGTLLAMSAQHVHKCYEKHLIELSSAMQARNAVIAGMCERRAVETLQNLDVTKIPDERKARTIKDLVDSAGLAHQNVRPPEEKEEESTMELIFRIKQRGQQPKPVNVQTAEEGDTIDAEESEQSTTKETP